MNGHQRIAAALRGERPDRVPVMLHNFMMAAREAGISMREYRSDARAIARCFIESVERYGYDGIVLDIDTATLAGALGVPVEYPEDTPARCVAGKLNSLEEVADLPPPRIEEHPGVQVWLEAARLLKDHFGDEVYLRGNCDQAPYSLAALMRTPESWMMDLMDPECHEAAHRLLEYSTEATLSFVRLMAGTGVHMVSNGDSWAGSDLVSPRLYRDFALPYERRIVAAAHELGLPYLLHICGKTDRILDGMVSTGADGLELDYKTDPQRAQAALDGRAAFAGNLDPSGVLAAGTPSMVAEKTRDLLCVFAGTPRFILNAGCAIPSTTPPENIHAMIAAAREVTEE
ncbi:MAG: uroporphyrinogen decarboxylase family protein [Bryobacterales bacterium]|nr:uroporphyrinogen decarboxylase family protein [Bryobacterales bacterium]